ncbi:MAG TPA: toll/interleukin-1 receptor domain-containing protein, partial [Polyangiaceae bacterium]
FSVVDVGDHPESVAAVAFLHGHGIPALRLRQLSSGAPVASALERILYGGSSVGYPKDIVRWSSPSELDTLVRSRIQVIDLPPRRINSRKQAEDYFLETAKKPVNVFLSYSGQDQVVAAKISEALKKRFQKVFDYKDGSSIRPGEPWLQEIFRELAGSAVAVPLVSKDYYASDNCMHEAREIIAQRDSKLLHVIPIKLQETLPPPPEWFRDGQFERIFASDGDAGALVERIVKLVEERATRR